MVFLKLLVSYFSKTPGLSSSNQSFLVVFLVGFFPHLSIGQILFGNCPMLGLYEQPLSRAAQFMIRKSYFIMPLCADKCLHNESSSCITSVLQKLLSEECKIFFRDKPNNPAICFENNALNWLQDPGTNFARMVFTISI